VSFVRRLLSDAVVYSLTPLLAALVGFVLVPIYTRTFTPSDYGALALVNTTTSLATIFVIFGLDNSAAVWFWEHPSPEERRRTFSTWLAFTTVCSFVFAVAALALRRPLAHWVLKEDSLSTLWVLFAVNLVALNVTRIGIMWFRMKRSPWPAVLLGGLTSIGTGAFGVFFVVRLKLGLAGVIAGQAASAWLGGVVTLIALRGVFSARAVDRHRLRPMLRLSAPLVLVIHLSWLMGGAVSYFVNFLCSRADAGLYQVANSLASVIGLVIFAFDQAWAPTALAIRDVAVAKRVYGVAIESVFVIGLLLAFTTTAFARPALLVITQPQYVGGEWVLSLLSLNTVLINLPSVLSVTFAREKVTMPLLKATAIGATVTVVLLPFAAKALGKEGAALAVVVGSITIAAFTFKYSQRIFPIEVHLGRAGLATLITASWLAVFLLSRPFVVAQLALMIVHSTALVLSLTAALTAVYRAPLRAAWLEARAPRITSEGT
jgi:O-antigen/teichoic acid export membrane protein